jgi:hypothetical protein
MNLKQKLFESSKKLLKRNPMKRHLAFPLIVLLALIFFPRARERKAGIEKSKVDVPVVSIETNMDNYLPKNSLSRLGLSQVKGTKYVYPDQKEASYFEYTADENLLLDTISLLPFKKGNDDVNTFCNDISLEDVEDIKKATPMDEVWDAASFWSIDHSGFHSYQCVKPPFIHLLLVDPQTNKVYHRVETIG